MTKTRLISTLVMLFLLPQVPNTGNAAWRCPNGEICEYPGCKCDSISNPSRQSSSGSKGGNRGNAARANADMSNARLQLDQALQSAESEITSTKSGNDALKLLIEQAKNNEGSSKGAGVSPYGELTATTATEGTNGGGQATARGSCRTNLSYLASRVPRFSPSELQELRTQALATNVEDAMRMSGKQGFTPESAIKASLDQARQNDSTAREALGTAASTDILGATDDEFIERINRGALKVSSCNGIRNAAICAAIATKIGAITNRALAAEMECHLRAGTWAR